MDDLDPRRIREALSISGDRIAGNLTRRRFLAGSLAAAAAVTVLPACKPVGKLDDGILIVLHLGGGNDGWNTVVPIGNGPYRDKRRNLAITNPLPLDASFGLHPALPKLRDRFTAGKVAIVQGVGQTTVDDLSHFSSTASWMAGTAGTGRSSGWLGRWLDGVPGAADGLRAVAMGASVPLHLQGTNSVVTALDTAGDLFGADRSEAWMTSVYDAVSGFGRAATGKGVWADKLAVAGASSVRLAGDLTPMFTPELPNDSLTSQLTLIARLINAGLGVRVFDAQLGSFDTHDGQLYEHDLLLKDLDAAIAAFYATLAPAWAAKVSFLSFSEFGRRAEANGSAGTDHGTSSCSFVIGDNVKGGFYGQFPRLDDLDPRGNAKVHVDHRSLYASVLKGWLGGDDRAILGASYPDLGLYARLPGGTA